MRLLGGLLTCMNHSMVSKFCFSGRRCLGEERRAVKSREKGFFYI